ncbi:hypothetical protein TraAM80_09045 [Trypanosoma rangeli]|uniref:Metaxin glutathione S-transferase domain-containing protein n=1 Tax=Trypanosoma rangeli TaxID=5698 RepID=A0A3R7N7N1_TRYRA|nr:uncharacterized protein TraAM80_09045 [Trypanosoma rangeli]RNE97964.1 hypothetical protein TraAM80_09045 [Trypanosoma rangeli]|eukprot:RNE97964.1 hypothetical protein TraAM80_09045 [Trypanosoma rangeli]
MAHDETKEYPTVTLFRYPACFAIPTADPHALAVECMLRFVGAHFVKRDAPLPVALEIPTSSGSTVVRETGLLSCLQLMEDILHVDAEVLSVEQRHLSLCVSVLVEKSLLPAFVYLIHSDKNLFNHSIRKGVEPKVATLLQRLQGNYRSSVLDGSGCCGRHSSVEEALAEVEKGLRALQAFHVSHSNSSGAGTFFLGTERPCSADALAYAAASSFLHADFASHHAPAAVVELQRQLKEDCPALVTYIEKVRQMYFEEYSAYYTIRTNKSCTGDASKQSSSEDDVFKKGRWTYVAWTIGFTMLYFVLSNANLILEALSELGVNEPEEEEAAVAAEEKSGEA